MARSTQVTLLILGLCLLFAMIATWYVMHQDTVPSAREQALTDTSAGSEFTDVTGQSVTLTDMLREDVPVVVTTWASWCPTCQEQLQALQQVAASSRDEVLFLAINRNETRAQAQQFLNTLPDFPDLTILLDPDDRFYRDIAGYAMPETVIYGASGEIAAHLHGNSTAPELEAALQALP